MTQEPLPKPTRPALHTEVIKEPVSPEILVPRLGDFLIEMKVINIRQLQHALDFQRANAIAGNPKMLGQVLVELGYIDRETLDRVITEQIIALQRAIRESNDKLETHVRQRTGALEWRLNQIRTAAEVAQRASSATRLEDLLKITVQLIVDRFEYYHAAIYLLDHTQQLAVLREATGKVGQDLKDSHYKLAVGSQSVIGWVTEHKETRIVSDVQKDSLYLQNELLAQTRSEACIPLLIDDDIVGVLDVQAGEPDAFHEDDIAVLQTLANQIAASIKTLRILETTRVNLDEVRLLFNASHHIAKARTSDEVLQAIIHALEKTTFQNALLLASGSGMQISMAHSPDTTMLADLPGSYLPVSPVEIETFFRGERRYVSLSDKDISIFNPALIELSRRLGCQDAVFLPIKRMGALAAVVMLGSLEPQHFNDTLIQPFVTLTDFASTALEKIFALEDSQEQIIRLEILNTVSHEIATETNLKALFRTIHDQVKRLLGETSFFIALYEQSTNTISFPYMYEDGDLLQIDPIQLGAGLTSWVINHRKPLMIVEDTERRAKALGALSVGKFAKSWLGVPLFFGNQIIGVMTVQDTENEYRFSEGDKNTLATVGSQVSVAIRNARLIESIRKQADHQKTLYEITEMIRRSVDIHTILETTSTELGKALAAHKVQIEIALDRPTGPSGNGKEESA
jgi:GAF domain-containing protein